MYVELAHHHLSLPRKRFEISSGVRETAEVFIAEAKFGSITGLGSGTPATSVGDSVSECRRGFVHAGAMQIDPSTYFDRDVSNDVRIISPAAAAALDIAMWDLRAKMDGVSLTRLLGGSPENVPTDATIDIRDAAVAAKDATSLIDEGFKTLKVKVGKSLSEDIERVRAVRKAIGNNARIFVDANGGYDLTKAQRFWDSASGLDIDMFEQPVPQDRIEDLAMLRKRGVRICADESVTEEESLSRLIVSGAADVVNIKLMKCGGLSAAIRMEKTAREAGIQVMLGCMGDIGISIAAAAHFACAVRAEHVDLDSHLSIMQVCDGPAVRNGEILLGDDPGHGVGLAEGWNEFRTH